MGHLTQQATQPTPSPACPPPQGCLLSPSACAFLDGLQQSSRAACLCVRLLARQGFPHPFWRLGLLEGASSIILSLGWALPDPHIPPATLALSDTHPPASLPVLLGQMTPLFGRASLGCRAGGQDPPLSPSDSLGRKSASQDYTETSEKHSHQLQPS